MYEEITYTPDEVLEYLRKSRSDDPALTVEEVLAKHEAILAEWAEHNIGTPIPENNIYREVVSGETIDDRPEVLKVLKRIENPKIKAILVVEVQRLSRGDLEDAGRLMKLLRYTGTAVITPQKIYDLSNEYDRDLFERELKRGNEFLEYQKKILNRGRLLSVSQGNYLGSVPPYGYHKTVVMDGRKKCPTLEINEEEAAVVRMIFDLYVKQDMGRTNIANRLNQLGIHPRNAPHWEQNAIQSILENVHYIGKVRWNWRKTVNIVTDGEIQHTRPKKKTGNYLLYEGKHPPIISEELFAAAAEKRGRNARNKANTQIRNPLAGILYCQCGRAMSLRTYHKNGAAVSAPRLICDAQAHCKTISCGYTELLHMVEYILQECINDFAVQIKNDDSTAAKTHATLVKRLQNKLRELENKEISQWEKYAEAEMPKAIFEKLNDKVLKEISETQKALAYANDTMPSIAHYEERIQRFSDALNTMRDPHASAAKKNKLLKACIVRITYNREHPQWLAGVIHESAVKTPSTAPEIQLDVTLRL